MISCMYFRLFVITSFGYMSPMNIANALNKFPKILNYRRYTNTLRCTSSVSILHERLPSKGLSLDSQLVSENTDLVESHIRSRRGSAQLLENLKDVRELRVKRSSLISESNKAKSLRNNLSQQIGKLMKEGNKDEVEKLKEQVEAAKEVSTKADFELESIQQQIDGIVTLIPNLLDDRFLYFVGIQFHLQSFIGYQKELTIAKTQKFQLSRKMTVSLAQIICGMMRSLLN